MRKLPLPRLCLLPGGKAPGVCRSVGEAASRAVRVRERLREPTLSFFMSQHPRLGDRATVPELDGIVLSLIGQYVSLNAEDSLPWAGKNVSPPGEEEVHEEEVVRDIWGGCGTQRSGIDEVWDVCNDCSAPLCPHCWFYPEMAHFEVMARPMVFECVSNACRAGLISISNRRYCTHTSSTR